MCDVIEYSDRIVHMIDSTTSVFGKVQGEGRVGRCSLLCSRCGVE